MKKDLNYLVIGICSGILIGLSLSPVIEKTLSILLATVTSLVGIASGISVTDANKNAKFKINPFPLTLVMIGIVFGSFIGIFFRNNNLLGSLKLDLPQKESTEQSTPKETINNVTGLNSPESLPCDNIKSLHGTQLKNELEKTGDSTIDECLKISTDSLSLEIIKKLICN